MKLLAALVALSFQMAQGRLLQTEDTVPAYTSEECDVWLAGASAFDTDASGGLSSDEYFAVLSQLGLTTVATSYSELGFYEKMIFSTLSCECVSLGMGEDCCTGANAEIPLSVLSTAGDPAVDAYKADLCNSLASVILEDTTTPPVAAPVATGSPVAVAVTESPAAGTTFPPVAVTESPVAGTTSTPLIFDVPGVVDGFDAAEIQANEGANDVLAQVINGFEFLSNEVSSTLVRKVRVLRASERNLRTMTLDPVVVTDIACPAGVVYADEGSTCVNFKFTVLPEEMSVEATTTYSEEMTSKINAGELYNNVKNEYPDTFVNGLGNPGAGAPIVTAGATAAPSTTPVVDKVVEEPVEAEPEKTGLSSAAIVFIVLAVILVPIAIVAGYARYRKVQDKERMERLRRFEASQASRAVKGGDDEFYDPAEYKTSKAGSSLAAMGAAGTAVTMVGMIPSDLGAIEEEVRILVEETKTPKSADELLQAYAGREADLLKNLRKMKALQDKNDSIRAEVVGLCQKVDSPKTADELLESYSGREDELLKNLRRLSFKQQTEKAKKAMRTDIIALVEELELPKSADELLTTFEGRESELLKNLNKMKAKKADEAANIAEINVLIEELAIPKSADEMLTTYKGREGVLLSNLKKMSSKKIKDAEIKVEVETLVEELNAPKSADEMLASYQGREEVLLSNLRKLKSQKEMSAAKLAKTEATVVEIRSLCDELKPPKTAEEMLASYKDREEELLKNLKKMKSRNDMAAEMKASKAATIAEVTSLVGELKLPKTANEMLASYEGREEELLKNLQKMKSKQESAAAQEASKAATIAEVTSLCDELKPGKSAEELLAAYEGREGDLLTHLKKLKSSKRVSLG